MMSQPTMPEGKSGNRNLDDVSLLTSGDTQQLAELSLGLRNLSFTITDFLAGEHQSGMENLPDVLFSLHRQALRLAERLDAVSLPNTNAAEGTDPACDDVLMMDRLRS
ncbi:MAG: hypothetical protein ACK5IB_11290 [Qingshengfaniella sp.]